MVRTSRIFFKKECNMVARTFHSDLNKVCGSANEEFSKSSFQNTKCSEDPNSQGKIIQDVGISCDGGFTYPT